MEAILAYLVSTFDVITRIVEWGTANSGAAFFFGAFLWAVLNTIVRKSKMKADDIVLDIFVAAIKSGFDAAFKRKIK